MARVRPGREFPHSLVTMRDLSRQAHQCHTVGAFSPRGPFRIATFALPRAVKRRRCGWLLSGSVVLVFADIECRSKITNRESLWPSSGQLASYRGATESFAHGEENPVPCPKVVQRMLVSPAILEATMTNFFVASQYKAYSRLCKFVTVRTVAKSRHWSAKVKAGV